MERQIELNEKTYTVKEMKYKDLASLADESKADSAEKMITLSTGLTKEEYDELSMRDGVALQKVINEINGLTEESFQKPLA